MFKKKKTAHDNFGGTQSAPVNDDADTDRQIDETNFNVETEKMFALSEGLSTSRWGRNLSLEEIRLVVKAMILHENEEDLLNILKEGNIKDTEIESVSELLWGIFELVCHVAP